jgi:hypothetical protein
MNVRRPALALTLAAAVLGATTAASAAPAPPVRPPDQRPHTIAATYDRDGVVVRRFDLRITRRTGVLHATVTATAQASGATRRVALVVGRCAGGSLGFPTCPPSLIVPVTLRAGAGPIAVSRSVTLRQPPPGSDYVQAALVTPGSAHDARFAAKQEYARVLLRGTAWRGPLAGQAFGVRTRATAALDVRHVTLNLSAVSPAAARPVWTWTGTAPAPFSAATTLSPCGSDSGCTSHVYADTFGAGSVTAFARPGAHRPAGATAFSLTVASGPQDQAATVRLPWPDPAPASAQRLRGL